MWSMQFLSIMFGVVVGLCLSYICFYSPKDNQEVLSRTLKVQSNGEISNLNKNLYNETLADELYDKVKILCWILTGPKNHMDKAIHIKKTWGQRCNKLIFISSKADKELGVVALPVEEGRNGLWGKTKGAFRYIYKHHFSDADWFLKVDDDNYVIPENIRYMLYQYRPQTALYFGHRYAYDGVAEGYMAGGGYILSKKALEKFVTVIMPNATACRQDGEGSEDIELGKCLQHSVLFADERDEKLEKRFFPAGIYSHVKKARDMEYWYDNSQYYEVAQGSLSCCSDKPAAFHYIPPHEMYMLEYLIRHVHPFGVDASGEENLPRKLTLKEIIRASDTGSASIKYKKHRNYHNLDKSEIYM